MLKIKPIRSLLLVLLFLIGVVPVRAQTTQPSQSALIISPDNAAQLRQVKMIGRGIVEQSNWTPRPQWFPDGKHVLVVTVAGIWVFDATNPADPGTFYDGATLPLAISADGHYLAFTQRRAFRPAKAKISIIDMGSGQLSFDRAYDGTVNDLAFTPDNTQLIVAGDEQAGITELWSFAAGNATPARSIPFRAYYMQYLPKLALMSFFGDSEIQLWDMTALKLKKRITVSVSSADLTPDASAIISFNGNNVVITNSSTKKQVQIGKDNISQYVLSPDGTIAAMPAPVDDSQILLWGVSPNSALRYLKGHTGTVSDLAYSPDGHTVVSSSADDNTTRLWDVSSGKELRRLSWDGHHLAGMAFSPDGTRLAAFTTLNQLVIQNVATDANVALWDGFYDDINSFAYNGTLVAATSDFGVQSHLILRRTDQDQAIYAPDLTVNPPTTVLFSADGTRLLAFDNTIIRLLDGQTAKLLNLWNIPATSGIALNRDGTVLAVGSYHYPSHYNDPPQIGVNLWDTATGGLLHHFSSAFNDITALAFSPDGKTLAVAYCEDSGCGRSNPNNNQHQTVIELWDVQSEKVLSTVENFKDVVSQLIFSHDGRTLVAGGYDGSIDVWDVKSGQLVHTIKTYPHNNVPAHWVEISPDDRLIASVSSYTSIYNQVQLWDSATGERLAVLDSTNLGDINAVAFSPDGRELLTANADGTIRVWAVPMPQPF